MRIDQTDRNFDLNAFKLTDGQVFYVMPDRRFDLYGVFYDGVEKRFLRIPEKVAAETSESVHIINTQTAGGRIRFSTDADRMTVCTRCGGLATMPHISFLGSSGFTLMEDTDEGQRFVASFMPNHYANICESALPDGFSAEKALPGGKMRQYTLYLPLYNDVRELALGFPEGAAIAGGAKYRDVKPVVYYGSSITQGGCASRPDNSYQAYISKWTNVDFINLGFSGSALAEEAIAGYIADIPMSVFVCDYDYNAPGAEHLEKTHWRLYCIFREKQPDTPVIFISNPDSDTDPSSPARLDVIRRTFEEAKRLGDANVRLIDGADLFGDKDRENCTVDGTHPNDVGFYRMAKTIYKTLSEFI